MSSLSGSDSDGLSDTDTYSRSNLLPSRNEPRLQPNRGQLDFSYASYQDHAIEYRTRTQRRIALVLILLCHLCIWAVGNAPVLWFPRIVKQDEQHKVMVPLTRVLYYMTGWIAGIIADTLVRKKVLLVISVLYTSAGIGACLVLLGTAPKSEDLIPLGGINGSDYPLIDLSLFDAPFVVLSPYNDIFFAVVTSSTFVMVFSGVVLPTLGGDQIPDRDGVRMFYSFYYLMSQCGFLIGSGTELIGLALNEPLRPWFVMLPTAAALSAILAIIVVMPKLTRQVRPDLSVIKDGWGIFVQAIRRRKDRPDGSNILAGAMLTHGGDYPDRAVQERTTMLKYTLTTLLLVPFSLSRTRSKFDKLYYAVNRTESCPNLTFPSPVFKNHYGLPTTIYMIGTGSIAISIVMVYVYCHFLTKYGYKRPTLLQRMVAGYVVILLSSAASLVGYYQELCYDFYKILPSSLNGIATALVITAVLELTFISAPRSMQTTAMGQYFVIEGISNLIHVLLENTLPSDFYRTSDGAIIWFWTVGIAGNILSLCILILVHWKLNLGLSVP